MTTELAPEALIQSRTLARAARVRAEETRHRIAACRRKLNPYWRFSGGADSDFFDPMAGAVGVICAPLLEVHSDRLVLAAETVYLADGMTCTLPADTYVEVIYTELAGRRQAVSFRKLDTRLSR